MGFSYLVFDVDGTLLNFGHAYAQAQKAVAEKLGAAYSAEYIELDEKLDWKAWGEFGLENTALPDIQANYHTYYYRCLRRHFTYLVEALGLEYDVDKLVECYLGSVAASQEWMEPGTLAIYQKLAAQYKLALATNGVSRVQRPRIEPLLPYTKSVFISEEMGYIKPAPAFFEKMLDSLGCRPTDCLMVGDSLSNDIAGAKAAGMHTCWYNPKGKEDTNRIGPGCTISSLGDLLPLCCQDF